MDSVSKIRRKKAKTREKQAGKTTAENVSASRNPLIGFLLALLFWAAATIIVGIRPVLEVGFCLTAILPMAGKSAYLLVSLLSAGLFLNIANPDFLRKNSNIILAIVISLLSLLTSLGMLSLAEKTHILYNEITSGFLLPLVMAPLLATILINSTVAIAIGVWTSLATAMLMGDSLNLFIMGGVVSIVTAYISQNVRSRPKVMRAGIMAGVSQTICVFGLMAVNWRETTPMLVVYQSASCIISGFISATFVLLIIHLFEAVFRITSNITLLELSGLDHPILQRLAIEAPGTYHHSLVVANLAQAAADEIGANPLLARIASYFHDIGKLTKPEFFAENISLHQNPHDNLSPSMSTLVITSHVKEGVSLAMLHKLPQPVINVIMEHHGTSLISCFHHKAREQMEFELDRKDGASNGDNKFNDCSFRYQGPKPLSRESAIICLADASEAASRSMEKPSPANIESMVNDIVQKKIADGQLSDCELTLKELTAVKKSFVFTLTSMLHGRMPYPEDEDRDKQPAKPVPAANREDKGTGKASDGTGTNAGTGKETGEPVTDTDERPGNNNPEPAVPRKR